MPLSAPTVVARYRLPVGRQGFLYHIHTISRCAKVLFVSDNIFYSIVVRCFERTWGRDASPQHCPFSSKGVSADPRAKGGDHLQVIRPTSRAVAGYQPLGKRG
jgi:hypothetical protein